MEKLKEAYLKINTNAEIEIQESDSTTGMTAAMEGTCDIGMASRELKDSELDGGLTSTAIAMDGIAVKSADTAGASEERPLTLEEGRDYKIVDTGDPVRYPFDAVVMAEDVLETGHEGKVLITRSVPGWQHVRPIGEFDAVVPFTQFGDAASGEFDHDV